MLSHMLNKDDQTKQTSFPIRIERGKEENLTGRFNLTSLFNVTSPQREYS